MTNSVTIPSAGAADTITVVRDQRNAFLADFTYASHEHQGGRKTRREG